MVCLECRKKVFWVKNSCKIKNFTKNSDLLKAKVPIFRSINIPFHSPMLYQNFYCLFVDWGCILTNCSHIVPYTDVEQWGITGPTLPLFPSAIILVLATIWTNLLTLDINLCILIVMLRQLWTLILIFLADMILRDLLDKRWLALFVVMIHYQLVTLINTITLRGWYGWGTNVK